MVRDGVPSVKQASSRLPEITFSQLPESMINLHTLPLIVQVKQKRLVRNHKSSTVLGVRQLRRTTSKGPESPLTCSSQRLSIGSSSKVGPASMSKVNSLSPSAKRPPLPNFGQAVCRWPGSPQVKQQKAAGLKYDAFVGAGEAETVVRGAGCIVLGRLVVIGIAAVEKNLFAKNMYAKILRKCT